MPALHPSPHQRVVVTHALRTPIGRFMGAFARLSAVELGTSVVRELLSRAALDTGRVDEVLLGNARQAGGGPNPARQVALAAGLPVTTPATTINMACGSGLKAINLGADAIRLGRRRVVLAGGIESMSGVPFYLPRMRAGYRIGHGVVVDGMYKDGFECPLADMLMGATAEKLARDMDISRDAQDTFALESQRRAEAAAQAGRFDDELAPVEIVSRKGTLVVDTDEHPRAGSTLEGLARLAAVFDTDGSVTAGNSSGITDGAAAMLLMSEDVARELELEPLAYVGESRDGGVDPKVMGLGPVPAVRSLQAANGLAVDDYDLIELNEAFAAQVLACERELELPMDRVNVNGGSIALGHPIGATGTRIAVTLLHELRRRGGEHGLATLCISGGMGLATAFHRTAPPRSAGASTTHA